MDDMKLLLVGGAGAIRVVVILNWRLNRTTRSVSGFSELYVRDRNGMPVRRQREVCSCSLHYPLDLLIVLRLFFRSLPKPQPPSALD